MNRYTEPVRAGFWTLVKGWLLRLYGLCIRVRVVGRVGVPLRRGFIIAANHVTGVDSVVLQVALRTRLFFVTSTRWLKGGFARFFMTRLCDSVPGDAGGGLASVPGVRRCLRLLRAGGSVGIYPEGHLNRTGRVERVTDGAAYLAVRSGVPVLPVRVSNLRLGPELASRPWFNAAWEGFFSFVGNLFNTGIEVRVGEPIVPHPGINGDPRALRREVARITAELRRSFDRLGA